MNDAVKQYQRGDRAADRPRERNDAGRPSNGEGPSSHGRPWQQEDGAEGPPASSWRQRLLLGIGLLAALLLVAGGGWWWWQSRFWESTDDAFLESHVTQLAPQVAGRVARLLVDDNQQVAAGDLLLEIDPRDYQLRLDNARAQYGSAAARQAQSHAQVAVRRASISQSAANVTVAEADLQNAEANSRRFRSVDPRAVTQQQRDNVEATTRSARARLEAARQAVVAVEAEAQAAEAEAQAAEAAVNEASVAVDNAALQLSYTRITAPVAGRVANRRVELGNYVTAGQALLAVVEPDVWVTANFKETQLDTIRPGQPVEITVDAYSRPVLHGRVDSIQRGTGARFSVLPPQNATGNYVKITQRVPVKILLADARAGYLPLSPGLSVVPRVRVRD